LEGVVGKHAKNYGNFPLEVQRLDPLGGSLADKVKMGGFPSDYAANGNHGIGLFPLDHLLAAKREFKTPGDVPPQEVPVADPTFQEGVAGPLVKGFGDFGIPLGDHKANAHLTRIREFVLIEVGEVLASGGHQFPFWAMAM
jgi:hypothetical protein